MHCFPFFQYTGMRSKDDDPIAVSWQLAVELDGDLIPLVEVDLKAVALKLAGDFRDKGRVLLEDRKLVHNRCPRVSGIGWRLLARSIETDKDGSGDDGQGNKQPGRPGKASSRKTCSGLLLLRLLPVLCLAQQLD